MHTQKCPFFLGTLTLYISIGTFCRSNKSTICKTPSTKSTRVVRTRAIFSIHHLCHHLSHPFALYVWQTIVHPAVISRCFKFPAVLLHLMYSHHPCHYRVSVTAVMKVATILIITDQQMSCGGLFQ